MSSVTTAGQLNLENLQGKRVVFRMLPLGIVQYRFRVSKASLTKNGLTLDVVEGSEEVRKVGGTFVPRSTKESPVGRFYIPATSRAVVSRKRIKIVDDGYTTLATIRRI